VQIAGNAKGNSHRANLGGLSQLADRLPHRANQVTAAIESAGVIDDRDKDLVFGSPRPRDKLVVGF
jgi:hypothetical protein